jgi:hypothetical protein
MKPDQLELHFSMEDEAPFVPPSAQEVTDGSRLVEAALPSEFAHRLDALEVLIEERCARLDSQIGRRMTVLEAIVQSRSAELAGQCDALDKTWAMAQAVVMELDKQLGVRLDTNKDLERRLSELSAKVMELDETRDQLPSSSDQQSAIKRLGEHLEGLETSLQVVRSRCEEMGSVAEVLRSDVHGTSGATAVNRQHLDVMQTKVEALQLQVDQVGLKVTDLGNEEKQGIQFGLQMLDRIYKIYDGIRADTQKHQQEGCGNVPDVQEYKRLLPTSSSASAECLGLTTGATPSAASSQVVRVSCGPLASPSPQPRNSHARVVTHASSSSTLNVVSRQVVPEEAGAAPLRTRTALIPQSYGNRSESSLAADRHQPNRLGSVPPRAPSPQRVPDDASQTVAGTGPTCLETAAVAGLVKHNRMAHAGLEGPHVPRGHIVLSSSCTLASTLCS